MRRLRKRTATGANLYEDTNSQPHTINPSYNEAWTTLSKYFMESVGIPHPNLCLDTGYPKTKAQWIEVKDAMIEILAIGQRNGWLNQHVDGTGRIAFWVHKN